jgi:HD-GYP domain-containing protein (c-di-GMP phosphodiesterase class II)
VDGTSFRPDGVEVSLAPLLELAEETEPDLAAHMDRTARLALRFGLHLDLSPPLLDQVVRTARVHDIGHEALAGKPALLPIATLVRSMNERWDGTGTPDGLSGSSIPLPSRIVTVCDAFDSLANPPHDAEPRSPADAMDDLVHRSGTEFDPGVVEPFRDMVVDLEMAETHRPPAVTVGGRVGPRP